MVNIKIKMKHHKELQDKVKEVEALIKHKRQAFKQALKEQEELRARVDDSKSIMESLAVKCGEGAL